MLPLNALRVFDAAARHLSFTRAADELAVTPAAVGQQIRALEDVLGVILFRRTPKGLEMTPEAEAGLAALRQGFECFEESVRAMRAGQSSQALAIAAPSDVIQHWLTPRLAAVLADDPALRITLMAADGPLGFTESNLDCAIIWGSGPGELEGVALQPAGMVMVVNGAGTSEREIGWPSSGSDQMHVPNAGAALAAVEAGIGRARVPALLADHFPSLQRSSDLLMPDHAYWVVAPTPQWRQTKVQALVKALTGG